MLSGEARLSLKASTKETLGLREYRGRGIAVSLKLSVLDFAKREGYERVKTWNDSTNAAMLGINMMLGFKRQVGWIIFEKKLA